MPQLLIELFSEEIPARMQGQAERDLERLLGERLKAEGLAPASLTAFCGPRRLAVVAESVPARQADAAEERKGPRVGAPDAAIQGFLKGAGLARIEDAEIVEDKKGAFYVARIARAGKATPEVLAALLPEIVRAFPWPKSMRSGAGALTWVRPLHNVLCLFDGAPVALEIEGVGSAPEAWGHRFHAPGAFQPKDFEEYRLGLLERRVILEREARKARILEGARGLCAKAGLELVEDAGLLEEVAGLAEWPVPILGAMDPAFLDLPAEVIRLTMRTHQRYFAVRDPKTGRLAPRFVTIANVEAKDGGAAIAAGNARVLSARLSDARFFWEADKARPLESLLPKLDRIVFHEKLGSVGDKAKRVEALAVELAAVVPGAGAGLVREAARLCKADLVTETVGEFPELQGQVGRQLYVIQSSPVHGGGPERGEGEGAPPPLGPSGHSPRGRGEMEQIAQAIEDHYRPLGPSDRVPADPVSICVALADKLDTLAAFWAIGEKPTGSKDPYALRRAALGILRTLLTNSLRLQFWRCAAVASQIIRDQRPGIDIPEGDARTIIRHLIGGDLPDFISQRLKVQLREQGKRHDLVDAVFALGDDDLVRIAARVEALSAFLATDDGANLLAGYRRAANILKAEEKKDPAVAAAIAQGEAPERALMSHPAEQGLLEAIVTVEPEAASAVAGERFEAAMAALARLRAPVDAFFEDVLVNDANPAVRKNRLLLLARARGAMNAIADFGRIEG